MGPALQSLIGLWCQNILPVISLWRDTLLESLNCHGYSFQVDEAIPGERHAPWSGGEREGWDMLISSSRLCFSWVPCWMSLVLGCWYPARQCWSLVYMTVVCLKDGATCLTCLNSARMPGPDIRNPRYLSLNKYTVPGLTAYSDSSLY